ncbi:MAG TPA: hypothetical protein VGJ19_14340 [Streptosporangiaceae bacterium]
MPVKLTAGPGRPGNGAALSFLQPEPSCRRPAPVQVTPDLDDPAAGQPEQRERRGQLGFW